MATFNTNWPRWIAASVQKHFDANKGSLTMYIEGMPRNTDSLTDFFELRLDGPYFTEVSKGAWNIYIEVNVLIQSSLQLDLHKIHKDVGIVSLAFIDFEVKEYSDGEAILGCMQLLQNMKERERLQVSHFGEIRTGTRLAQATVEGHYAMLLK